MPKRRADTDPDYDDPEWAHHLGHFLNGDITQLTDKAYEEGQARPRNYQDTSIGFDLNPANYRKRRKRK